MADHKDRFRKYLAKLHKIVHLTVTEITDYNFVIKIKKIKMLKAIWPTVDIKILIIYTILDKIRVRVYLIFT